MCIRDSHQIYNLRLEASCWKCQLQVTGHCLDSVCAYTDCDIRVRTKKQDFVIIVNTFFSFIFAHLHWLMSDV